MHPLLDLEEPCDLTLAINGFYPPRFEGEDATGWEYRRASILYVASQVRTCQQVELARENLARLQSASNVTMIEPVPYEVVRGIGFYRQFLSTRDWPRFMRAGRLETRRVLAGARSAVARTQDCSGLPLRFRPGGLVSGHRRPGGRSGRRWPRTSLILTLSQNFACEA